MRASQVCAHSTELHVLRYSSFQKIWGFWTCLFSGHQLISNPHGFPQIKLIPRVSNRLCNLWGRPFPALFLQPQGLSLSRPHETQVTLTEAPRVVAFQPYHWGYLVLCEQAIFCVPESCFSLECLSGLEVSVCSFGLHLVWSAGSTLLYETVNIINRHMKKMLNTSPNVNTGKAAELMFLWQTVSGILQTISSVKPGHYSNSPHFDRKITVI